MRTIDYLNELNSRFNWSDYRVSKELGLTTANISRWRQSKGGASEETALRIAEILKMDPALVLADIRIEHSKNNEVKDAWQRARKLLESCVLC